ncbi:uncharacterized protein LOC123865785 [Maniola jurtina]|uniref:uncharacterized protein LOC123865785 n=1 Tax=Maniola jurtina TaxID=191418 RepID=UPI001E68C46C|nr:uncharacterized protein LOC123865785 [Maniola jurtina]
MLDPPLPEDESMSGESRHSNMNNNEESNSGGANKRARESDSTNGWTYVGRHGKRRARTYTEKNTEEENTIEVGIYSKESIPKQFQLAKLLRSENITDVTRIRYVNPYKVRIQFSNIESAEKLVSCNTFLEKGWRIQKTYEVGISYGIIRNVEIELPEEEIKENIRTEHELVSVKRLMRRNDDETGWLPSETIRLGFKGTAVPSYVYVCDMRIQIEKYVFSVTQCTKCWRFGHSKNNCPNKKIVCPKCTGNHDNCETTNFKCVNCSGPHWSLNKSCPIYKKEKKIREIMSQFNVTFKKASTMYAPPSPPNQKDFPKFASCDTDLSHAESMESLPRRSYAEAAKENYSDEPKPTTSRRDESNKKKKRKGKEKKDREFEEDDFWNRRGDTKDNLAQSGDEETTKKKASCAELLERIAEILFMKSYSITKKTVEVLKLIWEWFLTFAEDKFPSLALIKQLFNKFNGK